MHDEMIRQAHRRPSEKGNDLLALSAKLQKQYERGTSAQERKKRGQIFTPPTIARFMAGLLSAGHKHLKVLDPGAGIGVLSAAVCERILRLRSPRHVEVVLYETDPAVIPFLTKNMKHCSSALEEAGHRVSYEIRQEDFILSNSHVFEQRTLFDTRTQMEAFDVAVMNPPYFKLQKCSEYARAMDHIVHGQPNIYALFMGLTVRMLRQGGEFVAITPRSFCNGLYFRGFRRWFFERMSLRYIHLFESRKDTFLGSNILQESIITKTKRSACSNSRIAISTSFGAELSGKPHTLELPSEKVIKRTCGDAIIRIPATSEDARIMEIIESWPKRFTDHSLRVSTGPVVMFRATEFLLDSASGHHCAPLLSVHNVRPFKTIWPVQKNGKPTAFKVYRESLDRRLLVPTKNYVLLRRFSAKEEKRRLTASCFLRAEKFGPYVALENHINYIYHAERELSVDETYGIAALFNSALLDRYFRTLSGNTQVNATELRTMRFPKLETLARIGHAARTKQGLSRSEAEHIVLEVLGVNGSIERHLMESAQ